MTRDFQSPARYVQGPGVLGQLNNYTSIFGEGKVYLIVDKFIAENYKDTIMKSFSEDKVNLAVFGGECSHVEIDKHVDALKKEKYVAVVGIGGGKTLDTSKAVGFYQNVPVLVAPTAASSDAPSSALSVVYTEEGQFEEYLFLKQNPSAVIMDEEVIINAPVRLFKSGIGDALATFYEADATRKSNSPTLYGGSQTNAAYALARLCYETLLDDAVKAVAAVENKSITQAVSNVIEANTLLSGLGFESGGLAGAHAIHNGMTAIEELHGLLHGEKVAFGTLTQMVLENRSLDEIYDVIDLCKQLDLPTNFEELGIPNVSKEKLLECAHLANAENDTMGNMPFEVTDEAIVGAMYTLDKLSQEF